MIQATIQRWGNSKGIRIPKNILDAVSLSEGDSVSIEIIDNSIIIKPHSKLSLEELFKDYKGIYPSEDYTSPIGKEVW